MTTTYGFTAREASKMYRRFAKVLWPEWNMTHHVGFSAKPYPKWLSEENGLADTHFTHDTLTPFLITIDGTILPWLHEDELECLILHEMAHVLAGYHANHGDEWKSVAKDIGAHPYPFYVFREWEKMPEAYQPNHWMLSAYGYQPTFG